MSWAHCDTCGKTFKSVSGFDKHRIGTYEQRGPRGNLIRPSTRRCMASEEMLDSGFQYDARNGRWAIGSIPERVKQHWAVAKAKTVTSENEATSQREAS